jgi:hypothetical protein
LAKTRRTNPRDCRLYFLVYLPLTDKQAGFVSFSGATIDGD